MLPEMVSASTPTEPEIQENNEQTNGATVNGAASAFTPDPNKVECFYRSHINEVITKYHLNNRNYILDMLRD